MTYGHKEVISDTEAERFARNLCKKRAKFPNFDEALDFVSRIRKVVSETEHARMNRDHCRRLAWQRQRDERDTKPAPPTVKEAEAVVEVRS